MHVATVYCNHTGTRTDSLLFLGRGKVGLHLTLPRPYFRVGSTGSVWFGLVYWVITDYIWLIGYISIYG